MSRPIVLSNGELHVGLNAYGLVHDFYFPYVGLENHSAGKQLRHRIAVWVDGRISWLDDGSWTFQFSYPHDALIGHTVVSSQSMNIVLEFDDFVDSQVSAFVRNIHVINGADHKREIRLFMHQAFVIGDGRSYTDTAQYLPDSDAILHYRGRRAFIISGRDMNGQVFDQYTVGLFGIEGHEGTFRDADDGELSFGNVEHGQVDSVLRFTLQIHPHDSGRIQYWIAAGTSSREALYIHKQILDDGAIARCEQTAAWWHTWLLPALQVVEHIDPEYRQTFLVSTMILKSQIDKRGAVIASTDTTMLNYSRDAYAYCWPRDGAYVLWPLIRMGYVDEAHRFFEFCRRGLHPNGYLMHKYRADGALGSSWHPYIHEGGVTAPPIQEDETALVLFLFAQFYTAHPEPKLLHEFYHSMVVPMAEFLASYIDPMTHLPKPSYDLWEEVFLTTTHTTSVVYAALLAAADLADVVNDSDHAVTWRAASEDMQQAAHKHLYNVTKKTFYKGILAQNGEIHYDETIDSSSFFGAFMFGLFAIDSVELQDAVQTVSDRFGLTQGEIGLPRYENDYYYRVSETVIGNWWFICSLWMAQYQLECGHVEQAKTIVSWVQSHMAYSGILSEQVNPLTQEQLSVAPLTWSHAELLATLLDTIQESPSS